MRSIPFEVATPDIDETPLPGERAEATALRLSRLKAEAIAARHPGALVIGSDQVCTLDGAQIGEVRTVALRPEIVSLHEAADGGNQMRGTVEDVDFLGSIVRIRVRFGENAVSLDTFNNPTAPPPPPGQPVTVSFPREAVLVLEGAATG